MAFESVSQYRKYIQLQDLTGSVAAGNSEIPASTEGTLYAISGSMIIGSNLSGSTVDLEGIDLNGARFNDFLDEDNMSSNSATAVASQQSIKAYVDASGALSVQTDSGTDAVGLSTGSLILTSSLGLDVTNSVAAGGVTATFALDLEELTAITAVQDADKLALVDNSDSNALVKMTRGNLLGSALAAFDNGLTSTTVSASSTLNVVGAANFGPSNNAVIAADGGLTIDHFDANWTNAGNTVADLGTITTVDINGGSIDATTIGAAAQRSVKATTLSGSSTLSVEGASSFGPGALTTISAAGVISGSGHSTLHRLTADRLAGGSISGSLTANSVTADQIAVNVLDVNVVNSNTITQNVLEVQDYVIVAGMSGSSSNLSDGGFQIGGGAGSDGLGAVLWNDSDAGLRIMSGSSVAAKVNAAGFQVPAGVISGSGVATIYGVTTDALIAAAADINAGTIDNTVIGGSAQAAGSFTTISGSATLNVEGVANFGPGNKAIIAADGGLTIDHFDSNWTNAGITVADLGTVTTVDINGGTIDGITSLTAAGNLDIGAHEFRAQKLLADGLTATHVVYAGTNGELSGEANFLYDDSQNLLVVTGGIDVAGMVNVTNTLVVGGGYGNTGLNVTAAGNLNMDGDFKAGEDGDGSDLAVYGDVVGYSMIWDADASNHEGANAGTLMLSGTLLMGQNSATSGYAIDVATGFGNVRADAFVTYSDRELKKDIAPIEDSLDKVMKLEAVSYNMKHNNRHEIGFVAQDVAKVVPEICALDNNGIGRGIDYGRLTSLLAGAVQSQQSQIAELKAKIEKLQE